MYYLSILILTLFFFSGLHGQDWKPYDNQSKKQKNLEKYDYIYLLDSTGVNVTENGSGSFAIRQVIKIQTPAGALKNRIIRYDYDPLTAYAEFKSVKIYKPDGRVIELDPAKSYDYAAPARAIYWGARQIMIEPGRLDCGDIIDYEISKKVSLTLF